MKALKLVQLCTGRGCTIASCESLTAGLFSATIAGIPGASKVLKGGIVTYFTEVKEKIVHVNKATIEEYGVVSAQCAMEMAQNTRELLDVDYCVSFTGNAGPDVLEGKPAGLIYCAIASRRQTDYYCFLLEGSRNEIRSRAVEIMTDCLEEQIRKGE